MILNKHTRAGNRDIAAEIAASIEKHQFYSAREYFITDLINIIISHKFAIALQHR